MSLTAKQKTDLSTLKTAVNTMLNGHASQRVTMGTVDATGTTAPLHANDEAQEGLRVFLRRLKRELDQLPQDSDWA